MTVEGVVRVCRREKDKQIWCDFPGFLIRRNKKGGIVISLDTMTRPFIAKVFSHDIEIAKVPESSCRARGV